MSRFRGIVDRALTARDCARIDVPTPTLERFRAAATAGGHAKSADWYETILKHRARREARPWRRSR